MQIWNAATQEGSSGPASRLHSALMAVLTHMVGRLGPLAIQDPHIQSVLYALLQKGLEGSPAQQEVLVEDALKLLNATLSASSTLAEPLQVCCSLYIMQQNHTGVLQALDAAAALLQIFSSFVIMQQNFCRHVAVFFILSKNLCMYVPVPSTGSAKSLQTPCSLFILLLNLCIYVLGSS